MCVHVHSSCLFTLWHFLLAVVIILLYVTLEVLSIAVQPCWKNVAQWCVCTWLDAYSDRVCLNMLRFNRCVCLSVLRDRRLIAEMKCVCLNVLRPAVCSIGVLVSKC